MAMKKKAVEPAAPEKKDDAPVKAEKAKVRRFVGKRYSYHHPFQNKNIPIGGDGVILEMDSWLDAQVKAGLIVEV